MTGAIFKIPPTASVHPNAFSGTSPSELIPYLPPAIIPANFLDRANKPNSLKGRVQSVPQPLGKIHF